MGWPGPMTHRQFAAHVAWLDLQHDVDSKQDVLLTAIAVETRRGWVKNPEDVSPEDFKVVFKAPEDASREPTEQELADLVAKEKGVWFQLTGAPVNPG